jgi:patatin-like phospholipase/acyl hydrolase
MAIVRQLRQLEERTGRHIHELFDLICGTSTGGILAVALALKQFSLDECQEIYRSAPPPPLCSHLPLVAGE